MRLPSRGNRGSPSLVSRSSSWRDKPDCVRWSTRPARVSVPCSATAATRRRCRVSRIMLDARGHERDSYIIIPPCGEVVMRGLVTVLLLGVASIALHGQEVDWSANGREARGPRNAPASEIPRTNVNRLAVAWTYRTGETDARFKTEKPTAFEATPLVVDGTMYLGTPLGRVIALDPATGRERWVFDPKIKRDVMYGDFASRGVSTWLDESAPAGAGGRPRVLLAPAPSQLTAPPARRRPARAR